VSVVIFSHDKALRVGGSLLLVDGIDESLVRVAEVALCPHHSHARKLEQLLTWSRQCFNAALEERRMAWRWGQHRVGLYDQFNQISELREVPEIASFGIQPVRGAMRRVDHAFAAFFARVAKGDKPGYPRFKGKSRYRSVDYDEPVGWKLKGLDNKAPALYVQGVGDIPLSASGARQLARLLARGGEPRTLRLVRLRSGGGWHACVSFRNVSTQELPVPQEPIGGFDRGVVNTIALPDGTLLTMPKFLAEARAEIKEAQRQRALTKPGSSEYRVLLRRIAKAHLKAKNRSTNWARHTAKELVGRYGVLVLERLELPNMVRSAKGTIESPGHNVAQKSGLNRSLHDAALSRLAQCICVKAEQAGRRVWAVPARGSSIECAACGYAHKDNRVSQAVFSCRRCGQREHADVNAAQVITSRGQVAETAWAASGCPPRSRPKPRLRRRRGDDLPGEALDRVTEGAGPAPHAGLVV